MDATQILIDAANRLPGAAEQAVREISQQSLHARPGGHGNSIAWLVWHAARGMDAQLARLIGTEQVWASGGWADRLGIPRGPGQTGFADTAEQVSALHVEDPQLLLGYLRQVVAALVDYVGGLSASELDVVVDRAYDPPVTRGVRLVSLIGDSAVHLGQAAYARGLVEGWSIGY